MDKTWVYPFWIPPLWSDLAKMNPIVKGNLKAQMEPTPEEQLAMVLPLESWGLIRNANLRRLPSLAPQFWPVGFSFFSFGRKWLWECEALLPPLTADRLREILKEDKQ